MSFRDVQILFAERLATKQDRLATVRAVITDAAGNQSGSGSVWFNQAERRVWCMPLGGTQPASKFCPSGLEPVIGLGVILGYPEGATEQQILRSDDEFFQKSSQAPSSFTALTAPDLAPGGKQFLWLQPKALVSLAVWPGNGLTINVNPGDYSYQGTRKTFAAVSGYDLTSSKPSAGQHRLVGLYIDSNNSLQIINGTAVSTSAIPTAPAWPADAFRLATVKLSGSSTSIDFVGDIGDMRLLWGTDGVGVWPRPGKVNIGATEYSSLTAALSAAVAGDVLTLGVGTHSLAAQQTLSIELTLVGINAADVIISGSVADVIKITAANVYLKNLSIQTTASGNPSSVRIEAACTLENCIVRTTSSGTDSYGIHVAGSGTFTAKLIDCDLSATGGSGSKRALIATNSNSTTEMILGRLDAATGAVYISAGVVRLFGTIVVNGSVFATSGWYFSSTGDLTSLTTVDPTGHKHSQLWESDGGAIALSTDALGHLLTAGNLVVDTGYTQVRQLVSKRNIAILDDTAVAQQTMAAGNRFLFGCVANAAEYFFGVCTYNAIATIANSGFSVVAGGGTLTGTTGPDGTINLRDNNGQLYIENRRGSQRNVGFTAFGSD